MLDISEPSYMRRIAALITQRKEIDVMKGVSSSLTLTAGLLCQRFEHAKATTSKLKEIESSANNLLCERDHVVSALELERTKAQSLAQEKQ